MKKIAVVLMILIMVAIGQIENCGKQTIVGVGSGTDPSISYSDEEVSFIDSEVVSQFEL